MKTWTINCRSCGHHWKVVGNWSDYEREAVESRPCPHCAAYTLSSPEPTPKPTRRKPWMLAGYADARRAG